MLFKLQLEACKCFKVREILGGNCGFFHFAKKTTQQKTTKLKSFQKTNERISLFSAIESKYGWIKKKAIINPEGLGLFNNFAVIFCHFLPPTAPLSVDKNLILLFFDLTPF